MTMMTSTNATPKKPMGPQGWACLAVVLAVGLWVSPSWGSDTFGSVRMDAEGLLHLDGTKAVSAPPKETPPAAAHERYGHISLPKLAREVENLVRAGKPLDERHLYLDGLVQLERIYVDPANKELLIAGPREPWDASDPDRPRGKITGRPVLQLQDLVVMLRLQRQQKGDSYFGCSLDFTRAAADRMVRHAQQISPIDPAQAQEASAELKKVLGAQEIRCFNLDPTTRIAAACIEADYILKHLALARVDAPVAQVRRPQKKLEAGQSLYNRWWFVPAYQPLTVSADGRVYELHGPSLKLLASNQQFRNDTKNLEATTKEFAAAVTDHFDELCEWMPAFADLANICDLGAACALIVRDDLAKQANWDDSWLLANYPLPRYQTAKKADSLLETHFVNQTLRLAIGGVELNYNSLFLPTWRRVDTTGRLGQWNPWPQEGGNNWSYRTAPPGGSPRAQSGQSATATNASAQLPE